MMAQNSRGCTKAAYPMPGSLMEKGSSNKAFTTEAECKLKYNEKNRSLHQDTFGKGFVQLANGNP